MSKQSLLEAFHIQRKSENLKQVADYDVFTDKNLLDKLRTKIIENLIDKQIPKDEKIAQFINEEIDNTIQGVDLTNLERNHLYHLIDNEIRKFGPLTELLEDEAVSSIMINNPHEIYIETSGEIILDESISFINEEHIKRTIEKLIEPVGKTLSHKTPFIEISLPINANLIVMTSPLTNQIQVVIQKNNLFLETMEDLLRVGSVTPYMATFLATCLKGNCNILICGKKESGKTTILNTLINLIPPKERIVLIEKQREIKYSNKHLVSLLNKNFEDPKNTLINYALKMKPNHLIVADIMPKDCMPLIEALNQGYDGSIITIDSSSALDGLQRLETQALSCENRLPKKIIDEYILNNIDIVIYTEKLADKKRRITSICEVSSLKNGEFILKDIFAFTKQKFISNNQIDGEYILYNEPLPKIYNKLKNQGINDIDYMFPIKVKTKHK